MQANDYLIFSFDGDTATLPNTYTAKITAFDPGTGNADLTMLDDDSVYTFTTDEPWSGTDSSGKSYQLTSHDEYKPSGTDPSKDGVALVTFSDGRPYLCHVDSLSPEIEVIFYHQPYPQLSFDLNNNITVSNWGNYPVGSQITSIQGCTLNNDAPIDPSLIQIDDTSGNDGGAGLADAPKLPYNSESWRPLVKEMAGDIPVEVLLRWIHHESGGNPCSTGMIKNGNSIENGLFQLYSPDNDHFATPAQLHGSFCTGQKCIRELTLDEARIQVASGIAFVRQCRVHARAQLQGAGVTWDEAGSDFWSLVKFQHNVPSIAVKYIKLLKPATWADFKSGVIKDLPKYDDSTSTVFSNAEDIGSAAV